MKSFKVRFNLGRGPNYMKWKVQHPDGKIEYFRPTEVQLIMEDCTLKNQKNTALKIFNGANKTVCAWVLCKHFEIKREKFIKDNQEKRLRYNPRVCPQWTYKNQMMDGKTFERIYSVDFGLYVW